MSNQKNHLLVILCGGTGPRLWPLSRADFPKQFLKIFSSQSVLRETVIRAQKIVDPNSVFIVSNQKYLPILKKDLSGLIKPDHIFLEPIKKNTTAAIIFSLSKLWQKYPEATVTFLPSDHYIPDSSNFSLDLRKCFTLASTSENIVAIGIKATSPNPAYGYLLPLKKVSYFYQIAHFVEKPNQIRALKLITQQARWNSGIYTAKISTYISEFKKHQMVFYRLFYQLINQPNSTVNIKNIYKLLPSISFDRAISEKTKKLIFLPASFYWNDIGDWKSVYTQLPKLKNDFCLLDPQTQYLELNSRRCLVSTTPGKLIGLVGVNNLAVIDTPDALLICNIAYNDSYNVRDLVAKIVDIPKLKKYFVNEKK